MDCFCQKNVNECNCSKIGLDSVWADSNKIKCYRIPVERNYSKPRGQQYQLAVAVVPGLNNGPPEPLLYLHGGPGIATLGNLRRYLGLKTFTLLRQDRSLIFFDYRGTGFSEPVLCSTLSDSIREISNAKLPLTEQIPKMQHAYLQCKNDLARQNILLSDFSTLQSSADAEDIRKQLGIDKWNIYAVSHGTTVALNMMRQFPKQIRSVILDSPFPPNAPWSDFVHPFNTSFKILEENIKADTISAKLFPSIRTDFIKISNQLRSSPLLMPLTSKTGATKNYLFDDGDFAWSVWTAMLSPRTIPLIPLALKEIAAGKDSILILWAKMFNDPNAFGEFALAQSKAILLYESKPRSEEEREQFLIQNFPDFASLIIPGRDSILTEIFRPDSPPRNYFDPVSSNIPTLVFSGEFDPVCPPLFAQVTIKTLSHSQLIVVPAASHSAIGADDCIRNIAKLFYQAPQKKLDAGCVDKREKIKFVTSDLIDLLR